MTQHPFDYRYIADKVMDTVFVTRAVPLEAPGPEIVYANDAYNLLASHSEEQTTGGYSNVLDKSYSNERSVNKIRQAMEKQEPLKISFYRSSSGSWLELQVLPVKDHVGEVAFFAFIERDISEQKKLQQILQEQPEKGYTTQLSNQKSLEEVLTREFSLFARSNAAYSLLIVDIDDFDNVCDVHGRTSGEQILHHMTTILGNTFRSHDEIFSIGSDTFCILLSQTTLQPALISAIRFRQSIQKTAFLIGGGSINITVSVGVSEVSSRDTEPVDVLQRARLAVVQAKRSGGDQAQIFSEADNQSSSPPAQSSG